MQVNPCRVVGVVLGVFVDSKSWGDRRRACAAGPLRRRGCGWTGQTHRRSEREAVPHGGRPFGRVPDRCETDAGAGHGGRRPIRLRLRTQESEEEVLWLVVADKPGMSIGWANWGEDRDPNVTITLSDPRWCWPAGWSMGRELRLQTPRSRLPS